MTEQVKEMYVVDSLWNHFYDTKEAALKYAKERAVESIGDKYFVSKVFCSVLVPKEVTIPALIEGIA